jgi:formylglycine-generating enzyme required for sulfatase activity
VAEWEYAARGGTTGAYYGHLGAIAWSSTNDRKTHVVGQKEPNMSGNVWEWCEDWQGKEYYKRSPTADPNRPPTGRC